MSNLGNADLGDGVKFRTQLTNINSVVADASEIRISIVDVNDTKRINQSKMTSSATGTYNQNIYLDPTTFSAGLHRVIFTGYTNDGGSNISFYHVDTFYIEQNRLI